MASSEIEALDVAEAVGNSKNISEARAVGRRHFLAALGMAGAVAGAGMISGCSSTSTMTPATGAAAGLGAISGQSDVLTFMLNVKYLQATFYSFVTQGTDLTGLINSGTVTGAPGKLTFTGANATQITDMFDEIYFDEKNHVTALMALLGSSAIPRPAINLAAYGTITASNAIAIARLLEDVALTAYTGAIPGLSSSSATVASQVFGADGFHAGALRLVSIQNAVTSISAGPLDVPPFDPGTATLAAAGPTANGGFFTTAGATTSNTTTPAGYVFARTTSQVLAILFGAPATPASAGTTSGGFFPSGVNGNIKQV